MLPSHCRHVSVHKVGHDLTPEIIKKQLADSKVYKGTEYLVLNNNKAWSVVRVEKTPGRGLFWPVTGIQLISSPEDTVYLEDNTVNVLNLNSMAAAAQKFPGKTVVVMGAFEHVSFYQPEPVTELLVLDVVPPEPAKLISLVRDVLSYMSFDKPVITSEKVIDIAEMMEDVAGKVHILPCNASGFGGDDKVYYLDQCPDPKVMGEKDKTDAVLLGCSLSLRIFKELYGFEPEFKNICPADLALDHAKDRAVLVKCCNVKDFDRKGNIYMVPWGATYEDIEKAIQKILESELSV